MMLFSISYAPFSATSLPPHFGMGVRRVAANEAVDQARETRFEYNDKWYKADGEEKEWLDNCQADVDRHANVRPDMKPLSTGPRYQTRVTSAEVIREANTGLTLAKRVLAGEADKAARREARVAKNRKNK